MRRLKGRGLYLFIRLYNCFIRLYDGGGGLFYTFYRVYLYMGGGGIFYEDFTSFRKKTEILDIFLKTIDILLDVIELK